jgi:hypothetical protein
MVMPKPIVVVAGLLALNLMVLAFLAGMWLGPERSSATLDAPFPAAQGQMVAQGGHYIAAVGSEADQTVLFIIDTNQELMIGYRMRMGLGLPPRLEAIEPQNLRAIFRQLSENRPKVD